MIIRSTCRVCESSLESVLPLGDHYVSDFLSPGDDDGTKAPLELVICRRCRLLQLKHTVPAERNPDKWGKVTVGTHIPIVSEADARAARPDYFLVLPWHFLEEFQAREKEFLLSGRRFIVPMPHFTLI